jgi:hypothetical protein
VAAGKLSGEGEQNLLLFTVHALPAFFYQVNQYYYFGEQAEACLLLVYKQLARDIKRTNGKGIDYDSLAEKHCRRLQKWLSEKQPGVAFLYPASQPGIDNLVVCAEYSVSTQLQALHIDAANLKEPILGIGGGKEHRLVN